MPCEAAGHVGTQQLVGTHTASDNNALKLQSLCSLQRPPDQGIDSRPLKRRRNIRPVVGQLAGIFELLYLQHHGRLEAGETEIESSAVEHRPRQSKGAVIARLGQ